MTNHPSSSNQGTRLHALALLLFAICLAACSRSTSDQAFDSDANGYACAKCGHKFYTERKVFAEFCPKCKTAEINEVMALVCPEDKAVMLAPRGIDLIPCSKCGNLVRELKLPQEAELKAWGATRETPETVMHAGQ